MQRLLPLLEALQASACLLSAMSACLCESISHNNSAPACCSMFSFNYGPAACNLTLLSTSCCVFCKYRLTSGRKMEVASGHAQHTLYTRFVPEFADFTRSRKGYVQAFVVCFGWPHVVPRTRQTALTCKNPFMRFCRASLGCVCSDCTVVLRVLLPVSIIGQAFHRSWLPVTFLIPRGLGISRCSSSLTAHS